MAEEVNPMDTTRASQSETLNAKKNIMGNCQVYSKLMLNSAYFLKKENVSTETNRQKLILRSK